jgi:hypothetical protein
MLDVYHFSPVVSANGVIRVQLSCRIPYTVDDDLRAVRIYVLTDDESNFKTYCPVVNHIIAANNRSVFVK